MIPQIEELGLVLVLTLFLTFLEMCLYLALLFLLNLGCLFLLSFWSVSHSSTSIRCIYIYIQRDIVNQLSR